MNAISKITLPTPAVRADDEFLSFAIAGQMFGIPVLQVEDVLNTRQLARIPLAPKEVAGALNLRGRIITAINMRCRLGIDDASERAKHMSIVVDYDGELYSLMVDSVGDVLRLKASTFEANPPTLGANLKDLSLGVYRLQNRLLVVLDIERLLTFPT